MSSDRTVLEHLLDGRNALVLEVRRLTTAIEELDTVISRIGGGERRTDEVSPAPTPATTPAEQVEVETVNSPVEVEPAAVAPIKRAPVKRAPAAPRARKAPAKKAAPRSAVAETARPGAPKSIRVHVLEMLAAEDRDFGLAEIIDRIHGEGIQAHDDAVRSITIKLMKDGRVERVGRGLYRLTRRGSAAPTATPAPPVADTPAPGYVPPLNLDQSWQRPGS